MKKIDRALQLELLQALSNHYPYQVSNEELTAHIHWDADTINANMAYLDEHGLVAAVWYKNLNTPMRWTYAKLTCRGCDFLIGDTGLSAILGVVTIKLHEETLKELIIMRIQGADLPRADKQQYLDQLRALPAETTKHLALRLVDFGLDNWKRALPLLQSILA